MAVKDELNDFLLKMPAKSWGYPYRYEYLSWKNEVSEYLEVVFSDEEKKKFLSYCDSYGESETTAKLKGYLKGLIARLENTLYASRKTLSKNLAIAPKNQQESTNFALNQNVPSVFIVHGHDNFAKEATARFVEQLGFSVIILHEQANSGKTVIEKFEDYADKIQYAIVLLTPDDLGIAVKDRNNNKSNAKYRARQNVILELGYFMAKLGRKKVCALHKGEIETPSDYSGIVYVTMDDAGGWKTRIAQEMEAAGLPIQWNRLAAS